MLSASASWRWASSSPSIDVAVDEQAERDVAQRAAAGGGGGGAERRGIGEFGVQGGKRTGMRAPEPAAHGLARDVDRVRIDVLADLARDVGLRRQAHRERREGVIDAAGAGVLDQRAEGGRQRPVALGRAAGANGADAADEDARRQALERLPAIEVVAVMPREDDEILLGQVVVDPHRRGEAAQER